MEGIPITYELHMREFESSFEADVDETEIHPVAKLFSDAEAAALGGGPENLAALQKLGPASDVPRFIEGDGNPWIAHTRVDSQKIESEFEAPEADAHSLVKRISGASRRANMRDFIKRRLATGETIASLAEYARVHDEETALLIEEIGAEL